MIAALAESNHWTPQQCRELTLYQIHALSMGAEKLMNISELPDKIAAAKKIAEEVAARENNGR